MTFRTIKADYLNRIFNIKKLSGLKIFPSSFIKQAIKNIYPRTHTHWQALFYLLVMVSVLCVFVVSCGVSQSASDAGWEQVPEILSRIVPPTFPANDFYITDYDAIGDGKTDCTNAFNQAIRACYEAGGGRIVIPSGIFLTGAIHLKSNINLYLTKNATILFSRDPQNYLPIVYTRFEGVECMNYSPFIYAYQEENIAITGSGTLDGRAGTETWWPWKGKVDKGWKAGEPNQNHDRAELFRMADEGVLVQERIFGADHYLRPNFIQPYRCKNILIDSVTIRRSPMWVIHPVLCENVTVQNVRVISHGPNNDGCNPESSKDILIKNSYFDTGDDCIAIKSGRNADGRRVKVASENIIIRKCVMKDGHGGVVIGSEMSGDCRNIFVENCTMDSPNLERALRIKTNSMRGGVAENIYFRNVTVGEVSDAVVTINFNYEEGDVGQNTPVVRDIYLSNITSHKSKYAIYLIGYKDSPVTNFNLNNCRFEGVREGNVLRHYQSLNMRDVYINGQLQN
jgi:polygalacturonase